MKTNVHEHSLEAYRELGTHLSLRASEIYKIYLDNPRQGYTDRNILVAWSAQHLADHNDLNYVRPRITELKQLGLIKETGKIKSKHTGRTVRVTRLAI